MNTTLLIVLIVSAAIFIGWFFLFRKDNYRGWEIAFSPNMPSRPTEDNGHFYFDIPSPDPAAGSAHYITKRCGPISQFSKVRLKYRIDMEEGTEIRPVTVPLSTESIISLYFQRKGDDWSGKGKYETYRWYATHARQLPIVAGEHEIITDFMSKWTAVMTSDAYHAVDQFRDALANAERIGFVLGGGTGYGHGVFATGKARLTILDFQVE